MPSADPYAWMAGVGGSWEFLEAIGPLSDPARFGRSAEDAFDVIVPSLPGIRILLKPKGKPRWVRVSTARLWHKLMTQALGYRKYGAQGGDWGAFVTMQLAGQFPEDLLGIHLNAATVRPVPETQQSEEEQFGSRLQPLIQMLNRTIGISVNSGTSRRLWRLLCRIVPWVPRRGMLRT